MASNLNSIWDNLITQLQTVQAIKVVEYWPMDTTAWAEQFRASGGNRIPAIHVAPVASEAISDHHTDADILESTQFRITCIFSTSGTNKSTLITLRDSLINSVCNVMNLGQNGYAETTDLLSWEISDQWEDLQAFSFLIAVQHVWARDAS